MPYPNKWNLEEIISFLLSKKVNSKKAKELIEKFEDYNTLVNSGFSDLSDKQEDLFGTSNENLSEIANEQIKQAEEENVKIITIWDDEYPHLLKNIDFPPILLFVKGILQSDDSLTIAMVGTRQASTYGKLLAEDFASFFARNGIIVVSGLAMGIDSISHFSTVKSGGITYAVLASGLDQISSIVKGYVDKIVDSGGCVVTEQFFGVTAKPQFFPQRNRIITGLSKAILVVESDIKGGSMISARFALDQGRDVFAIPGDIRSSKSKGCNYLLHESMAIPALSPKQVLEDLHIPELYVQKKKIDMKINQYEQRILDSLSHEPSHIDSIASNLDMDITNVMIKLLNLEFNGLVRQLPGKYYIKSI